MNSKLHGAIQNQQKKSPRAKRPKKNDSSKEIHIHTNANTPITTQYDLDDVYRPKNLIENVLIELNMS